MTNKDIQEHLISLATKKLFGWDAAEELIVFMNWVSKNWIPDNGIGYWVPSDNIYLVSNGYKIDESITTEELIEIYKPIQRDKKLSNILNS
jgi:hypothetical protein